MSRRTAAVGILAFLVAASPALLPAGRAWAETSFAFHGLGWGHGVGMPQWGAYGLALDGWTHDRILGHYYTGTTLGGAPEPPSRIRVGLLQGAAAIHLTAEAGDVELRLGSANAGTLVRAIPEGETWTVEVEAGQYRIVNARGKLVGWTLWGSATEHLFARYAALGSRARIGEAGHAYNRGWIEFNITGCDGCTQKLRLVANVPTEQYLYGVAEVYGGWPEEVLRAQAVAARTYALEKVARLGQNRPGCNCGVYGTTLDQVYAGWDKEGGTLGERWVAAVEATRGTVVLYQGAPIQAFFHASSGGLTESNENVWNGTPLPYLRGVCDTGDWREDNPYRAWSVTMTGAEVGAAVAAATGQDVGEATAFTGVTRGVSGRIVSVTVEGTDGTATLTGAGLRSALGLRSSRVWIGPDLTVVDEIREEYDRLSCAPGLPASPEVNVAGGHRQRFADGAVYHNHARAVVRWLHGPIYDKYVSLGQVKGVLGLPRSGILDLPALGGSKARFEGGFVYFHPDHGAHELHGPVLDHFRAQGGAAGRLGFPVTDAVIEADGTTWAEFASGVRVTCSPDGACSES